MKHTKVIVSTTSDGIDLVSNALFEIGSTGTLIVDEKDAAIEGVSTFRTGSYSTAKNAKQSVLVVGAIDSNSSSKKIDELKNKLAKIAGSTPFSLGELSVFSSTVEEPDWTYVWQNFYPPKKIGKFKIFPEWHKNKKTIFKIPVTIEVSDVFGTGHHPTTVMCLEFLQKLDVKGKKVFDIGSGTGILAICAKKLGADEVLATDISEAAVKSCIKNAKTNDVKINVKKADLLGGISEKTDILIANLSSELLLEMSKSVAKNMKNGGFLIASGIMPERLIEVQSVFQSKGFDVVSKKSEAEWITLLMKFSK